MKSVILALTVLLVFANVPSIYGETYSTQIAVSVTPNPAGLNHQIAIKGTITPSPPEGYFYEGITIDVTRPDGTFETLGPFTSASTGTVSAVYYPTIIGTYILQFILNEQSIGDDLYLSSDSAITEFVVHESDEIPVSPNPDGVPPVVSFTFEPSTPEVGVHIIFDASDSFDPDGTIIKYYWNFGDGTTDNGKITVHSYSSNGSYTVVLSAIDDEGCVGNTTRTIEKLLPMWSSFSQPSMPEFSLKLEAHPYDVPPVFSINQFTGENVTLEEGHHVENKSIVITIKNQSFTSAVNDKTYYFVYNVRVKGYYGENWQNLYSSGHHSLDGLPSMSSSENTVLRVPVDDYPAGSKLDFQVTAMVWHDSLVRKYDHMLDFIGHWETGKVLYGTTGWSETQTITITSADLIQTPDEPTPNEEESPQLEVSPLNLGTIVPILLVAVAGTGLLLYLLMRKR